MATISPSIFRADLARLGDALEIISAAGATMVHVDVADGHFVPEIAAGQPVVASLRRATDLTLDVHLLVERPERFVADFADLGVDRLSVHAEATRHLLGALGAIRKRGIKAGLALLPVTPLEMVAEALPDCDFVHILTAEPCFERQAAGSRGADTGLIPRAIDKVREAVRRRGEQRLGFEVEVEGGIGLERIQELARAGADILVVDSAIFDKDNPTARLGEFLRAAREARATSKV